MVMVRLNFFFVSGSGSTYSSASMNLTEVSDTSPLFAMVRGEKREEARVQIEGREATRATRGGRGGEGRPLLGEGEGGLPLAPPPSFLESELRLRSGGSAMSKNRQRASLR